MATETHPEIVPTRALYLKAADHIECFGLHKRSFVPAGRLQSEAECPTCVLGALLIAAYGSIEVNVGWGSMMRPMEDHLERRLNHNTGLIDWSDRLATTESAVAELRACAETLP